MMRRRQSSEVIVEGQGVGKWRKMNRFLIEN